MIDHTGVIVTDWAKARAFYDAVFAALGGTLISEIPTEYTGGVHVCGYGRETPVFWLSEANEAGPGRHTAFVARDRAEVDNFYKDALAAGGKDNGGPGLLPTTGPIMMPPLSTTRTATTSRPCAMPNSETWSGGCQCGAVRYRFSEKPDGAHIYHCRMCQKAFGAFYAPLVGGLRARFEFTRGELAIFRSSELAERGFCRACGTPLTFAYLDSDRISVSIGSLDHPEAFPPQDQHGVESRSSWVNGLGSLPDQPPTAGENPTATFIRSTNHQHPDHDTGLWPAG